MGGRSKFSLFKGSGINDILCLLSKAGCSCQRKALMTGSPDGCFFLPGIQILHIGIHLPAQIHIAVQQIACFHLGTLAHNNGKRIPVYHLCFLYHKARTLQQGSQRIKGIVGNVIPDQLIIAAVIHNILKAWNGKKSHPVIFQIIVNTAQHPWRIRLMLQKIKR